MAMGDQRHVRYVRSSMSDDVEVQHEQLTHRVPRQRLLSCPETREALMQDQEGILMRTQTLSREGHAVLLKSVINFRDCAAFNTHMRHGVIFRSARPRVACEADANYIIKRLGIKTIIDLREQYEADLDADKGNMMIFQNATVDEALADELQPMLVRLPFARKSAYVRTIVKRASASELLRMGGSRIMGLFSAAHKHESEQVGMRVMDREGLLGMNKMILEHGKKEILDFLKICATPHRHPVLLHCSHGKDRTGLASALLQAALGVDVKDIVSDYVASNTLGGTVLCAHEVQERSGGAMRPEEWGSARVELLLDTFKHIDQKYGSFHEYMTDVVKFTQPWQYRLSEALKKKDFGDDYS